MKQVNDSSTEKRSFWREALHWLRTPKHYELNQCAKDLEYGEECGK